MEAKAVRTDYLIFDFFWLMFDLGLSDKNGGYYTENFDYLEIRDRYASPKGGPHD